MAAVRQCCFNFGKEFKEFTLRGDIIDLAVGFMIGTVFDKVVKSLVVDIITPPFGFIFAGVDFSNLTIKMQNFVHKDEPPVVIRYGVFIQQILHLLVLALVLFGIIKFINRLQKAMARKVQLAAASEPIEPSEEVKLLRDIRDLIARNKNATNTPLNTFSPIEPSSNLINI